MLWVISYDVPDDGKRLKVASVLEEYGVRVQWSVFECRIDGSMLDQIQERVRTILGEPLDGSVRGYRACERCAAVCWVAGESVAHPGSEPYLVV